MPSIEGGDALAPRGGQDVLHPSLHLGSEGIFLGKRAPALQRGLEALAPRGGQDALFPSVLLSSYLSAS